MNRPKLDTIFKKLKSENKTQFGFSHFRTPLSNPSWSRNAAAISKSGLSLLRRPVFEQVMQAGLLDGFFALLPRRRTNESLIVSEEKFCVAQFEKDHRSNMNDNRTRKTGQYNSQNVLSGLLVCSE